MILGWQCCTRLRVAPWYLRVLVLVYPVRIYSANVQENMLGALWGEMGDRYNNIRAEIITTCDLGNFPVIAAICPV